MIKKLLFPLFSLISFNVFSQSMIQPNQAKFYVDKTITVCGQIAQVKKGSKQTYLNLGEKYPNQQLTFLIWDTDLELFTKKFNRLTDLTHQFVCGKGKITEYKRQYQMMLDEPDNLIQMDKK